MDPSSTDFTIFACDLTQSVKKNTCHLCIFQGHFDVLVQENILRGKYEKI